MLSGGDITNNMYKSITVTDKSRLTQMTKLISL